MIKKFISCLLLLFVFGCNNLEFVLKNDIEKNPLKNKTLLIIDKDVEEHFKRALYSFFGNNKINEYILDIKFSEKKENRIVKNNQVAEKIEYTLQADYNLFYRTNKCKVFEKTIISKFSFTPKSAGYNFGSDISLEKLYGNSVDENINSFIEALQINKSCLE